MTAVVPVDAVRAFVGPPRLLAAGAAAGPLAGVALAVKDLFDVAGTVTGAGTPSFTTGRPPATAHASAVAALIGAGASVVGKTITDELAYSLAGTNVHHGTPTNVAAPGRAPGGSSAGSAAAVAAGLVPLALGTDTGGSIRVPASHCGTYGWRPTHGAVAMDGVVPLAPSFDTAGLFALDPDLLAEAAAVLLGRPAADGGAVRLLVVDEGAAEVPAGVAAAVADAAHRLAPDAGTLALGLDLAVAAGAFRTLQGAEAWRAHGTWITATSPRFGPGIAARFAAASRVTEDDEAGARPIREAVAARVRAATADGTVLVLPAAPGPAPLLPGSGGDAAEAERQRAATLRLTCLAGLAGAPVVVIPALRVDGLPLGLALVGAPGSDRALLHLARTWPERADRP